LSRKSFIDIPLYNFLESSFHSWEDAQTYLREVGFGNGADVIYAAFKLGAREVSFKNLDWENWDGHYVGFNYGSPNDEHILDH